MSPDLVARYELRRTVAELRIVYDAARHDAAELARSTATVASPPGLPIELARDTSGRYLFLDALTALTSALTALVAAETLEPAPDDVIGYEVTVRSTAAPGVHFFHPSDVRIARRGP